MVWMRLVSLRRKPSLSASRIATRETSGMSSPSRSRLMPMRTSNSPLRRSRMISIRSMVSTSWCMYRTRTPFFSIKVVRSSAIFLVRVVTSTRSPLAERLLHSLRRSSICPSTGRTTISGSSRPVGRMTCSTTGAPSWRSRVPGVALTYTTWCIFWPNSSKFSGRLSRAEGSRKPNWMRFSFRERSPPNIPRTWGRVTWDSSMNIRKSSGK